MDIREAQLAENPMNKDEHSDWPADQVYLQTDAVRQDECDVAIIGAGIIGLVTAYRLQQLRPEWRIHIFEKDSALGGRLLSRHPEPPRRFPDGSFPVV